MGESDDEMRDAVADEGAKAEAEDQPMEADSDSDDEDRRPPHKRTDGDSEPSPPRRRTPPRERSPRRDEPKKEKVRIASSRASRIGDSIERAAGESRGVARARLRHPPISFCYGFFDLTADERKILHPAIHPSSLTRLRLRLLTHPSLPTRVEQNPTRKNPPMEMIIGAEDAAFLVGTGGKTKDKVARVAGARLDLLDADDGKHRLEIFGKDENRRKAKQYVQWVLRQRVGPITVDTDSERRDDLSVVSVPLDCVAYVMGKNGVVLRNIEEEYGTLMFFGKPTSGTEEGVEKLMILGSRRSRRGAELKVMSAVEHKRKGFFVDEKKELRRRLEQVGDGEGDGWGYDVFPFHDDEFSYALGAQVRHSSRFRRGFRGFLSGDSWFSSSSPGALTCVDLSGLSPCPACDHSALSRKWRWNLLVCGCSLAHSRGLVCRRGAWKLPRLSVQPRSGLVWSLSFFISAPLEHASAYQCRSVGALTLPDMRSLCSLS